MSELDPTAQTQSGPRFKVTDVDNPEGIMMANPDETFVQFIDRACAELPPDTAETAIRELSEGFGLTRDETVKLVTEELGYAEEA